MFHIFRIESGWIMGEFRNGSQTHFFDYSYITNFLEDFMKALLYVHGDWAQDEDVNQFKTISQKDNMGFEARKTAIEMEVALINEIFG